MARPPICHAKNVVNGLISRINRCALGEYMKLFKLPETILHDLFPTMISHPVFAVSKLLFDEVQGFLVWNNS